MAAPHSMYLMYTMYRATAIAEAHDVRVRAPVNVEFLLQVCRVDGQAEAELLVPVPSSARRPSSEYMNAHAIGFRMIRTPGSRVVWRPCLLRGTCRSGSGAGELSLSAQARRTSSRAARRLRRNGGGSESDREV